MWEIIQEHNPIWFIDATGSLLKDKPTNKDILLYTILCHDRRNHNLIPIAEFFLDDQSSVSISSTLLPIKKSLENNISKKKMPFAKVFITDQSWAIINSILEIFNNCTINQYLSWCFDIVFKIERRKFLNSEMPMMAYVCASHFIKNMVYHTKKI